MVDPLDISPPGMFCEAPGPFEQGLGDRCLIQRPELLRMGRRRADPSPSSSLCAIRSCVGSKTETTRWRSLQASGSLRVSQHPHCVVAAPQRQPSRGHPSKPTAGVGATAPATSRSTALVAGGFPPLRVGKASVSGWRLSANNRPGSFVATSRGHAGEGVGRWGARDSLLHWR